MKRRLDCVVGFAKIEGLRAGKIPIFEPCLEELVHDNVKAGRLTFSTDMADCVPISEVVFIGVGTPANKETGDADLTFVYAVAGDIAKHVAGFTVVVTKSTVPVGTGGEVEAIIRKTNPNADVAVVSNPEFLRFMGDDRGLRDPQTRRRRHRRRARSPCDDRGLSSFVYQPVAAGDHDTPDVGTDQICRQCLSWR